MSVVAASWVNTFHSSQTNRPEYTQWSATPQANSFSDRQATLRKWVDQATPCWYFRLHYMYNEVPSLIMKPGCTNS